MTWGEWWQAGGDKVTVEGRGRQWDAVARGQWRAGSDRTVEGRLWQRDCGGRF